MGGAGCRAVVPTPGLVAAFYPITSSQRRNIANARRNVPGPNRRGFLAASAAGLGAADLAASGVAVASASSGSGSQAATGLTEAVLVAFRSHRLINR
jgi:hypothetical protein